jgi:ATP diphosphatase
MGSERGAFDFDDVANAISDKLERRHPHVFGDEQIGSAQQQSRAWEDHKKAERAARGCPRAPSVLDAVHSGRPALQRATELQRAAASQGFDWRDAASVLPKLREELAELETAMAQPDRQPQAVEELGDLLFTCVNLARHLNVDADETLRRANTKFENRFRRMESRVQRQGGSLEDATLTEMDALWESGKRDYRE